ncbi:MAG: Do family serine endopeptidase [Phycisphaerae bacterium]
MNSTAKRLTVLAVVFLALAAIRFNLGGRLVSQVAYAMERGKIQANQDELQRVPDELAGVEKVANAFRLVAKVVGPSVVHIRVEGGEMSDEDVARFRRQFRDMFGDRFSDDDFQEWVRRRQRQVVGTGSGIVLSADGRILTNNHVVEGRADLRVTLSDGREFSANVVGRDSKSDLAVIKIDANDLHPLAFGDSDKLEVGDWVLAVGAPFGLTQTVTHGIVSAKGRTRIDGISIPYQDFIQTDAAINPGNSGGPLVNLRGQLVGVNTAIATNGDSYNAGVAFSIPSNMAARIADRLSRDGEVIRGWLGISMSELDSRGAERFGLQSRGVLVDAVFGNSPAETAGVLVDDVILSVNGTPVPTPPDLQRVVAEVAPGQTAMLQVARGDKTSDLRIKVGRRPEQEGALARNPTAARHIDALNAGVLTLTPARARGAGFDADITGVVVVETQSGADLRPGDAIVSADGRAVTNVVELSQLFGKRSQKPIELEVRRPNGSMRTVSIGRD